MKLKLALKPFDIPVILAACLLTAAAFYSAYGPAASAGRGGAAVQVTLRGEGGSWVYPLDAEEKVEVPGPLGNTVIRIHGNEAWVESSPCANQSCVAAGRIKKPGQWTACLPNNVFLVMEGSDGKSAEIDAGAW